MARLERKWRVRRCARAIGPVLLGRRIDSGVLLLVLRFLGRCCQILNGDAGLRLWLQEARAARAALVPAVAAPVATGQAEVVAADTLVRVAQRWFEYVCVIPARVTQVYSL